MSSPPPEKEALQTLELYSIAGLVRETGLPRDKVELLLRRHPDAIPHVMDGSRRRYTQDSVNALLLLWYTHYRKAVERDPDEGAWFDQVSKTLQEVSKMLSTASSTLTKLRSDLKKRPLHLVFYINSLPDSDAELLRPVAVQIHREAPTKFRALLFEAGLETYGPNDESAALNMRELMVRTFRRLHNQRVENWEKDQFRTLASFIRMKS